MRKSILALAAAGLISGLSPVMSQADEKPMNPAVAQLDLDGDLVLFLSTDTIEPRILNYVDQISETIITSVGSQATEEEIQTVTEVVEKIKSAIEWSGLLSLRSYAMSMAPVDDDLIRSISILSYNEADAGKPLWRILGSEPKELKGIGYVPADAVITVNSTASLKETWKVVREAVSIYLPPEQGSAFNQQIAMVEAALGVKIDDLTDSLDNEILFSLQFAEDRTSTIPAGGRILTIPEPSGLIGLQTESPMLSELLLAKLQETGAPVVPTQHGDYTLYTLAIPFPTPFPVSPTMVQTEDYLLIGTTQAVVTNALSCQSAQNGLIATPLYRKLLTEAPEEVSGIEFLSPRFMQTYMSLINQTMGSDMGPEGPAMMNMMFGRLAGMYEGSYCLKTPTGFYSKGYGNYGGSQPAEMVATAYVGTLAAIAIPSFQKARNNAMDKACINNLRILDAAKEQWALENNKADGDAVENSDITEYILGGIESTECRKGGTYILGPIGTAPSCSVHGAL